jgi:hypothetical protein
VAVSSHIDTDTQKVKGEGKVASALNSGHKEVLGIKV